jgi:ribA/ribD-fused uncharacterized protein
MERLIMTRDEFTKVKNTKELIQKFDGEYAFLSNFYKLDSPIVMEGLNFTSVEAAFQAAKCPERMQEFVGLEPYEAKKLGRKVNLRPDWENVKLQIMNGLVFQKFLRNKDLRDKLLATGDAELCEGNYWKDDYWGVCDNEKGQNNLGIILMNVRKRLKDMGGRFR